jgi:eukaryotic-like serine/threonine-protein kinase
MTERNTPDQTFIPRRPLPDPGASLDSVLHYYETYKDSLPSTAVEELRVLRQGLLEAFPHFAQRLAALFENERGFFGIMRASFAQAQSRPEYAEIQDFGDYVVQNRFEMGGFGEIYRVYDKRLKRVIVLKAPRIDSKLPKEQADAWLKREARLWAVLDHPSIAPIHELGIYSSSSRNCPYFTMKLVQGQTLKEKLDARLSPIANLAKFVYSFLQTAQAVAYAHDHEIIHRDIKSKNIMIGSADEVQVMDWGLAKRLEASVEESSVAMPERGVGTRQYMAPEQAGGNEIVGKPADVFSLGSLLCEILTGAPAYVETDPVRLYYAVMNAELTDAFQRLDESEAPQALRDLAKECLAKDPRNRPCDAGEVAARVQAYLDDVQNERLRIERERAEQARRLAAAETKARKAAEGREQAERSTKIILTGVACIIVSLMGLVGVLLWQRGEQARRLQNARIAAEVTELESRLNQQVATALALPVNDPQDLDRALERLDQCRQTISQILAAAEPAGLPVSVETTAAMAQIEDQYKKDVALVHFLARLDKAIQRASEWQFEFQADFRPALSEFRKAFEEFGLDPTLKSAVTADTLVNLRPGIRSKVVDALDFWSINDPDAQPAIDAVISRVQPADFWRKDLREAAKGDVDLALRIGEKLCRESGPIPASRRLLTGVLLREKAFASGRSDLLAMAIQILDEGVLASPSHLPLNLQMGNTLVRLPQPQYQAAAGFYRTMIAQLPTSSIAYGNLGLVLLSLGKTREAHDCFTKAISLQRERNSTALTGLALLELVDHGDLDKCKDYCQDAIRDLEPPPADALAMYGVIRYFNGDDLFGKDLDRALALGKDQALPVACKAAQLATRWDFDHAGQLCKDHAGQGQTGMAQILLPLGLLARGEIGQAYERLNALRDKPYEGASRQFVISLVGLTEVLKGDPKAGERTCQIAIDEAPSRSMLPSMVLEYALLREGRIRDAHALSVKTIRTLSGSIQKLAAQWDAFRFGVAANLELEQRVDECASNVAATGRLPEVSVKDLVAAEVALLRGQYRVSRLLYDRVLDKNGRVAMFDIAELQRMFSLMPDVREGQATALGQFQGITYRVNYVEALLMEALSAQPPLKGGPTKADLAALACSLLSQELDSILREAPTARQIHPFRRLLDYLTTSPHFALTRASTAEASQLPIDRAAWAQLWQQVDGVRRKIDSIPLK